jgi:hypothetical protein
MTEPQAPRPKKGPLGIARTVLWAFLGIRKGAAHRDDALSLKPHQIIIAGIVAALIFVSILVFLVRHVTS